MKKELWINLAVNGIVVVGQIIVLIVLELATNLSFKTKSNIFFGIFIAELVVMVGWWLTLRVQENKYRIKKRKLSSKQVEQLYNTWKLEEHNLEQEQLAYYYIKNLKRQFWRGLSISLMSIIFAFVVAIVYAII